jgi:hypothetical protein
MWACSRRSDRDPPFRRPQPHAGARRSTLLELQAAFEELLRRTHSIILGKPHYIEREPSSAKISPGSLPPIIPSPRSSYSYPSNSHSSAPYVQCSEVRCGPGLRIEQDFALRSTCFACSHGQRRGRMILEQLSMSIPQGNSGSSMCRSSIRCCLARRQLASFKSIVASAGSLTCSWRPKSRWCRSSTSLESGEAADNRDLARS